MNVAERGLQELYARTKSLTLAAGAALVLERPTAELADEAAALLADARAAAAADRELAPQLDACVAAAAELHGLLAGGGEVDAVRAAHSRMRREVWKVLPCEYVPCSGAHRHAHER